MERRKSRQGGGLQADHVVNPACGRRAQALQIRQPTLDTFRTPAAEVFIGELALGDSRPPAALIPVIRSEHLRGSITIRPIPTGRITVTESRTVGRRSPLPSCQSGVWRIAGSSKIFCARSAALGSGWFSISFTAAECGGVIPDASYTGAISAIGSSCGWVVTPYLIQPPSSSLIAFCSSAGNGYFAALFVR